ncbi:MAG: vitamin K epoxide reductase family protein [Gemmatimonadales bacterium]
MRHRQAIALLALVGVFVSLYLWLYKIGVIGGLQCGTGDCEYVQGSSYAVLFGVPIALYGVVGYALIFAVALAGLQPASLARPWPNRLLAALSAGGFLFSLYLTYLELFVIHAVCRWCVVSAVIITAITILALGALRRSA